MITHYIYHVPGRKCGCTKNFDMRKKKYSLDIRDSIVLLEELYDKTDQEAGDIEDHWNDQFGYPLEGHYALRPGIGLSTEQVSERARKAGIIGGRKGHNGKRGMTISTRCPHCGLEGQVMILGRWHFDRCPQIRGRIKRLSDLELED